MSITIVVLTKCNTKVCYVRSTFDRLFIRSNNKTLLDLPTEILPVLEFSLLKSCEIHVDVGVYRNCMVMKSGKIVMFFDSDNKLMIQIQRY